MPPSLRDRALAAGRAAGLDAVGVTSAAPFEDTRRALEERKAAGLHGGMQFTYRNPARATDPARTLSGARSLVVGALGYRRNEPLDAAAPPPATRGVVARYSWEDHYDRLRDALGAVVGVLEREGWRTSLAIDDNALVDRAAAHRAGIGWFGKNANLLLPGRGSWFVLGSVITDAPLDPTTDEPMTTEEGCGSCDRCLTSCPTGALVAPGVLDARRCLAWLLEAPGVFPREHREALGGRIYGCDDCQEVCPPNRLDERRRESEPASAGAEPWVDLVEMLALDDDALLSRYGRWYIPKRDAAYLRRNALIALGNVADRSDRRVVAAIAQALDDPHEIVRAHAVWAAARLGHDDLVARLEDDPSPLVAQEVGERPPARTG